MPLVFSRRRNHPPPFFVSIAYDISCELDQESFYLPLLPKESNLKETNLKRPLPFIKPHRPSWPHSAPYHLSSHQSMRIQSALIRTHGMTTSLRNFWNFRPNSVPYEQNSSIIRRHTSYIVSVLLWLWSSLINVCPRMGVPYVSDSFFHFIQRYNMLLMEDGTRRKGACVDKEGGEVDRFCDVWEGMVTMVRKRQRRFVIRRGDNRKTVWMMNNRFRV